MQWRTLTTNPESEASRYPAIQNRSWTGLVFLLVSIAAGLIYISLRHEFEPAFVLSIAGIAIISLIAMRRWPMAILAALLYIGNLKTTPAQGIQLSDPTMIVFLMCVGSVALEFLFVIGNVSEWSLRARFYGQGTKVLLFLFFLALLAVSWLYTPARQYGTMKLVRFAVFDAFAFFAPLFLVKTRKDLRQLLLAIIFLSIVLAAKDIVRLLSPSRSMLEGNSDMTLIGDGMLFAAVILAVVYVQLSRSHTLICTLLGIMTIGLVASGARSPMLALILTLVLSVRLLGSPAGIVIRKKVIVGTVLALLCAGGAFFWMQELPVAGKKLAWKQAEMSAALTSGSLFTGGTIAQRLSFYQSAIDAAAQSPLFGVGLGGWSVYYSKLDFPRFPHNFLLEVAAEEGIVGVVLLATLLLILLRSAYKLRQDPHLRFLLPLLIFLVIYNSLTGDIESRALWFWCGMVAAASRMAMSGQCASSRVAWFKA